MEFSFLKKMRAAAETALIAVFLAAIAVPLVLGLAGAGQRQKLKVRAETGEALAAGKPVAAADAFKRFFENNFGLRKQLIFAGAVFRLKALGVSSNPDVIPGNHGWLFLGGEGVVEYTRALRPLPPVILSELSRILERRRNYFAAHGILYLFVVCPDKESIYPEYYPRYLNKVRPATHLEQVVEYMQKNSSFQILDLTPDLLRAKKNHKVFYEHDTHWNDRGAYAGYAGIINEIGRHAGGVKPLPLEKFKMSGFERKGGDLARMLGVGAAVTEWDYRLEPPAAPRVVIEKQFDYNGHSVVVTRCDSAKLPMAIVFHDSFMSAMMPFMAFHFRKTYFIHTGNYNLGLLNGLRPTVIIDEMVERGM
jgi:alginate O-acetyltransferase complex protein AlgJ